MWEYGMESDLKILILEKFLQTNLDYIEGAAKISLELVQKSAWPTYSFANFEYINSGLTKQIVGCEL